MMFFVVFLLALANFTSGARILGVFDFPSYSHHVVYSPLYKELAKRGHEVVVITPNPLNDPTLTNLTEIDISYLYKPVPMLTKVQVSRYMHFVGTLYQYSIQLFEELMKNKEVRKLLDNPNEHFDLVIIEDAQPLLYAFGKRFNAPMVGILSVETSMSTHAALGNPIHPAMYTDFVMDYSDRPSIWSKVDYTFNTLLFKMLDGLISGHVANNIIRKHFGSNMPSLREYSHLSILLVSVNPIFNPNRPLTPQTIPIPFIHVRDPRPLPLDLQQLLDESTYGAIYFSLGSNVKSAALPVPLQRTIIEALSELPYTVLWKWEAEHIPRLGKNVVTRKWFPQQDILAHPNIKVFVFQGGLQSSEEAILRGKPMVGLPFISEQHRNVKIIKKLGIALGLEPSTMTKESLKNSIIEVAENKKYSMKIQQLKAIAEDQPMSSLDKAVFWTEYVIRHNGTEHLKSPAVDMPLYEYLLLDVIVVIILGLVLLKIVIYYIVKRVYQKMLSLYLKYVNKIKIS